MSEQQQKPSLYERLGGYDAVYAFAGEVLKTCMKHPDIGHIWAHVSESSFQKEHINFVDFLCKHWGGNTVYRQSFVSRRGALTPGHGRDQRHEKCRYPLA